MAYREAVVFSVVRLMKERHIPISDPAEPRSNGDTPCYVLVKEQGTPYLFGPYNKTFAEHLSETFEGTVIDADPMVVSEKINIKKGGENID
jgi:hypothetical protein